MIRTCTWSLLMFLLLAGCKVGRFVIYNFADTNDHRKFPSRALDRSPDPWHYPIDLEGPAPRWATTDGERVTFEQFLEEHRTVAFLVVYRDTIRYEHYFDGYDSATVHTSFSVAKSVTSMLIGCAIADGYIRSVDQPVTDFLPELIDKGWDRVTLEQVLQMTSGMDFQESYTNPFGTAATFYYGRRLRQSTVKLGLEREPGTGWDYDSGNTQLLGLVLEQSFRMAGDSALTITEYLQRKLWTPLGMEFPASWSIDRRKGGIEKTFCCLNTPARDFAKLGSLYLHEGRWQGQQLVPSEWVERSTRVDSSAGSAWWYQYQWWLPDKRGTFMAEGILGQYIYVDPAREVVIVRLGRKPGNADWVQVFRGVAALYGEAFDGGRQEP